MELYLWEERGEFGDTGVKFEMGANLINGKTMWAAGPFKSPSNFKNYRKILDKIPLKEGWKVYWK